MLLGTFPVDITVVVKMVCPNCLTEFEDDDSVIVGDEILSSCPKCEKEYCIEYDNYYGRRVWSGWPKP